MTQTVLDPATSEVLCEHLPGLLVSLDFGVLLLDEVPAGQAPNYCPLDQVRAIHADVIPVG